MTKDTDKTDNKPPNRSETMRELFSDKKDSFIEALECLYVPNNQGGRLMFAEQWPAAAERIFSDELVHYDYEGVKNEEDREKRAELEEKSNVLREEMLQIFDNVESRLVVYGSLQIEELDKIMQQIDRPIAEYVFSERFVDRYFPDASKNAESNPPEEKMETEAASDSVGSIDTNQSGEAESDQDKPSRYLDDNVSLPHKEVVEVPDDKETGHNIGHIDHSFSTSTPQYKESEDGEDSEDMKWLDVEDDDEFADVHPISTDGVAPTPESVNEHVPQDDVSAPKEMSLKEYQENHEDDDATGPLPEKEEDEPAADVAAPEAGTDQEIEGSVASSGAAPSNAQPQPEEDPPQRPMGMGGVRRAQEEPSMQETAQHEQPKEDQPDSTDAPPARRPMGMGGVGQQNQQNASSGAPDPKPEEETKDSEKEASSSEQEEKKDEKPAPRVPSLDDIDKHVSNSGSNNAPSGFPPIPGSEDD